SCAGSALVIGLCTRHPLALRRHSAVLRRSDETHTQATDDAILYSTHKLTASGVDIVAACAARGSNDTVRIQNVAKALDDGRGRALVARGRKWIEWNQIHLRRSATQQTREFQRVFGTIVYAVQHDIFESNAARILPLHVVPARIEQLRNGMFAIDRHELI